MGVQRNNSELLSTTPIQNLHDSKFLQPKSAKNSDPVHSAYGDEFLSNRKLRQNAKSNSNRLSTTAH